MKIKTIFLFLAILLFAIPTVYAKDQPLWGFIDNIGIDYQFATDSFLPQTFQGRHCINKVECLSIRAESRNLIFSDKWGLQGEFHWSAHKADERPDHGQDTGFNTIGFNAILKRYLFDDLFYAGVLIGGAYVHDFPNFENREHWSKDSQQANIGRSHCLASLGILVGKDWRLYKAWSVRTEARFSHSSDPFRQDRGKEFLGVVVGLTYNF